MATPQDLRTTGDRIERRLDELRAAADPRVYDRAEELLRMVTELYGAGLARVVELVGEAAPAVMDRLVDDDLVSSLLVVHGLHPDALMARIERSLESVRPFLAQHGGDVELLEIDANAGAVLLRLLGSCDGCPSSAVTLQSAVERAIVEAAPEIVIIDVVKPTVSPSTGPQPTEAQPAIPVALVPKPSYVACPAEMVS
jgi:Fe-S cluster biogenesis protein NfuA